MKLTVFLVMPLYIWKSTLKILDILNTRFLLIIIKMPFISLSVTARCKDVIKKLLKKRLLLVFQIRSEEKWVIDVQMLAEKLVIVERVLLSFFMRTENFTSSK